MNGWFSFFKFKEDIIFFKLFFINRFFLFILERKYYFVDDDNFFLWDLGFVLRLKFRKVCVEVI